MQDINFIANYYLGTKAYTIFMLKTLFKTEETDYIKNKNYQTAAQVGFISNILLSIKEDLVENTGNLIYESKLYKHILDENIQKIATKTKDGYEIDNYTFKDASTIIATIRNKLGHGDFTIDYDNEKLTLHIEGKPVSIKIRNLTSFIIKANLDQLVNKKTKKFKRVISKHPTEKAKKIKNVQDLETEIKKCENIIFTLEREDHEEIERYEITAFNIAIDIIKEKNCNFDLIQYYKQAYKQKNFKMSVEYQKLNRQRDIEPLLQLINNSILTNEDYDYEEQLLSILFETRKKIDDTYTKTDLLLSNIDNLLILQAMRHTKSTNINDIQHAIKKTYESPLYINYDNLATSAISNFNSLFCVPYDKLYKKAFNEQGLDFSKLNLKNLKIITLEMQEDRLEPKKQKINSLKNQAKLIKIKVDELQNNINNISEDKSKEKIKKLLEQKIELQKQSLNEKIQELKQEKEELKAMEKYYSNEELYTKNKTIIEGLRNAIAHGNYTIRQESTIEDTLIIFENIYEGKTYLKAEITIIKFLELMDNTLEIIQEYLNNEQSKQKPKTK